MLLDHALTILSFISNSRCEPSEDRLKQDSLPSFRVEQKTHSTLFDVVQEVPVLVETFVESQIKQVEWDVECLKRGLKALSDDEDERPGKTTVCAPFGSRVGCNETRQYTEAVDR